MIHGHLAEKEHWEFLASHPVWKEAFDWLRSLNPGSPEGKTSLRGDEVFGMVMRYRTIPLAECRFESHQKYVDIQYTLTGGEQIGWARAGDLQADVPYDPATDLAFYPLTAPISLIGMPPGHFAIFHPSDAHAPKAADGVNSEVLKAVVKIRRELV